MRFGILISDEFALTAANCILTIISVKLQVQPQFNDVRSIAINISELFKIPNYTSQSLYITLSLPVWYKIQLKPYIRSTYLSYSPVSSHKNSLLQKLIQPQANGQGFIQISSHIPNVNRRLNKTECRKMELMTNLRLVLELYSNMLKVSTGCCLKFLYRIKFFWSGPFEVVHLDAAFTGIVAS